MALKEKIYNRQAAIDYAKKWAFSRNPHFTNFDAMGGDCTNFVSQCLFAGCKIMNYTPVLGWYYININRRAAAWSGVIYLNNFLSSNKGAGPHAIECEKHETQIGDVIFLYRGGAFTHSLIINRIEKEQIYVAAHTMDSYDRNLDSYIRDGTRYLHITKAYY